MTDYRRERQSYVRRAGGDEGGQGWGRMTVLREMRGRQERMKNGRRRLETEEGGKDYQMRRWRSAGSTSTLIKGKKIVKYYLKCNYSGIKSIKLFTRNQHYRLGGTIGCYVLDKFTTKVSSIEPNNSGIDRYRIHRTGTRLILGYKSHKHNK